MAQGSDRCFLTLTFAILSHPSQNQIDGFLSLFLNHFHAQKMKLLLRRSMLKAIDVIVEQDTTAIETRYPHQPTKIKLPNEEVMMYAQKLYQEW